MGFPVGYTEVFIPTLFIHTLTFLTLLKKLIITLFNYLGLPPDFLEPRPSPIIPPEGLHLSGSPSSSPGQSVTPPPLSAVLPRELLPLVRVNEDQEREKIRCAVCLYEFCGGEEIRWLSNCKHIFHRECLDRWMDLDHRSCPLCRTPFLRDEMLDEFNQRLLSAAHHAFDKYFLFQRGSSLGWQNY